MRQGRVQRDGAPHLEVGLLEDARQLVGRRAAVGQRAQVLQDVLHQLHVVVPHRLQLGLLKVLMGLGSHSRGDTHTSNRGFR